MIDKLLGLRKKPPACQPSEKKADGGDTAPAGEEFEHCVICGKLTSIPVSMPIDWRENYEIGLGQVCAECAKKQ